MRFINQPINSSIEKTFANASSLRVGGYVVTASGGRVVAGQLFKVRVGAGGLASMTAVTLGGVACSSVAVVSDTEMTAIAPVDGLLHKGSDGELIGYQLEIT